MASSKIMAAGGVSLNRGDAFDLWMAISVLDCEGCWRIDYNNNFGPKDWLKRQQNREQFSFGWIIFGEKEAMKRGLQRCPPSCIDDLPGVAGSSGRAASSRRVAPIWKWIAFDLLQIRRSRIECEWGDAFGWLASRGDESIREEEEEEEKEREGGSKLEKGKTRSKQRCKWFA